MDWIFGPAVAMYLRFTNIARFPIAGSLFLIPLAIAVHQSYAQLSAGALLGIAATLLLALYFLAGLYFSSKYGWGVVTRLAQRINEHDLRRSDDAGARHNLLRGQFGEMFRTLRQALDNLREVVSQVYASAETIRVAAHEIAVGNTNLSQRTETQAATLEETAAGMEELAATVRKNAENCQVASGLSRQASEVAQQGAQTMHRVVDRMAVIDASSKKIADIIGVIEGIGFQTNILALNAAVEAARAGEQGQGFAVVASEVRNLAQRSATAAKEIKALIEDAVATITEGSTLVAEAGRRMDGIVGSVRQVTELIGQIAVASKEQSAGVEATNKAIVQMESVTQQNATLVQEAAAATLAFEEEARRLSQVVSKFKIDPGR
jgi:methyl-accepting chemotaxis protein